MHEMQRWTRLCEATSNILGSLGASNHSFFMFLIFIDFLYVMLRGNFGIVQTVTTHHNVPHIPSDVSACFFVGNPMGCQGSEPAFSPVHSMRHRDSANVV